MAAKKKAKRATRAGVVTRPGRTGVTKGSKTSPQTTRPRTRPARGGKRPSVSRERPSRLPKEEAEVSRWTLGAIFLATAAGVAGAGYGVKKHLDAKTSEAAAEEAARRVKQAQAAVQDALRRAADADERARKLAMALAADVHHRIAKHRSEDAPPLHFDGCLAARTDGVVIRIDIAWMLTAIVDPAREHGAISGRVAGVLAHEWYHFLDMARGTRSLHEEELTADAFAGRVLARLTFSPDHFADLLRKYPQSRTHPEGELRAGTMLVAHGEEQRKMGVCPTN